MVRKDIQKALLAWVEEVCKHNKLTRSFDAGCRLKPLPTLNSIQSDSRTLQNNLKLEYEYLKLFFGY